MCDILLYCYICVLILLCVCPHTVATAAREPADREPGEGSCICVIYYYTAIYVSSTTIYVSSYYNMSPHTTIYVSSCYYVCVLMLLYMRPHTAMYASSYYYTCVRILLYMCPYTTIYVSSYYYVCSPAAREPADREIPGEGRDAACVLILLY